MSAVADDRERAALLVVTRGAEEPSALQRVRVSPPDELADGGMTEFVGARERVIESAGGGRNSGSTSARLFDHHLGELT